MNSGKETYIIFVVRDDSRSSDLLFQTIVTTYEAYNVWGGKSLYDGPPATKVSFDRPYLPGNVPRLSSAPRFLIWEYPMVRFLEREGYDVTYCSNVDIHRSKTLLTSHRAFLSVGHDEYWSWEMRSNVERARDHGVSLGFFCANSCYWQIRFEPNSTGSPDRTIVCYKSTSDPVSTTPLKERTTVEWRQDPVNRPKDDLIGVMYNFWNLDEPLVIADASHWVCANTGVILGDHR